MTASSMTATGTFVFKPERDRTQLREAPTGVCLSSLGHLVPAGLQAQAEPREPVGRRAAVLGRQGLLAQPERLVRLGPVEPMLEAVAHQVRPDPQVPVERMRVAAVRQVQLGVLGLMVHLVQTALMVVQGPPEHLERPGLPVRPEALAQRGHPGRVELLAHR